MRSGGKPARWNRSRSAAALAGGTSEGFHRTPLPAVTGCRARAPVGLSGEFQGAMMPITPRGPRSARDASDFQEKPMAFDPLAPLPLVTADLPGIGGRIKTVPEDFEVEEIPAYQPSGNGDYLYLWVEKRDMGAEYFTRQVARRLDIPVGEVGTAGLKDRHAVTRQMVSVPAAVEPRLAQPQGDGIRVLQVQRHGNKLKPGHLH